MSAVWLQRQTPVAVMGIVNSWSLKMSSAGRPILGTALLAISAVAFGLACGGANPSPTSPAPPTPAPVSFLWIRGDTLVAPGATSQLRALAYVSGVETDVASEATWTTSDANIASVSITGLVTAINAGSTTIGATYRGLVSRFELDVLEAARVPEIEGDYRLVLTADRACTGGDLPEEARRRTYAAYISQRGLTLRVDLKDAVFVGNQDFSGGEFYGKATPEIAAFELRDRNPMSEFDWYSLAERLPGGALLIIAGRVDGVISPGRIEGLISGSFWLEGAGTRCTSDSHSFVMTR